MFELLMPFFLPGVCALLAWLLGFSDLTILAIIAIAVFFLQLFILWLADAIQDFRQKYNTVQIPSPPPCRCGGRLKSTSRSGGYRCRDCDRLYHFGSSEESRFRFVEKLSSGYTLAYMKTEKGGKWEADIPPCSCGNSLKLIANMNNSFQYVCNNCNRKYSEIAEANKGIWFKEIINPETTVPYMKCVRWDTWETDQN